MDSYSCVCIDNCACGSPRCYDLGGARDAQSDQDFYQTSTALYRPDKVDKYICSMAVPSKRLTQMQNTRESRLIQMQSQKKYHAYRKIWNCNQFYGRCKKTSVDDTTFYNGGDGVSLSWKNWPPPIVPVPQGLKIPVQEDADTLKTCAEERSYLLGEDEEVNEFAIQPKPVEEITKEMCLKGVLNTFESHTFTVHPPTVLFKNPVLGDRYTVVVKVRNKGLIPRRLGVINPVNASIDVAWGAGIGEQTLLPPGLSSSLIVTFRPQNTDAVNDVITIIIDDDGAIVVPIIAKSTARPLLEMEEWDVGCSTLGASRIENFNVTNTGNTARFWILTEEEFMQEYIELHGPRPKPTNRTLSKSKDKSADSKPNDTEGIRQTMLKKANNLIAHPFRIFPSCFRLQRNQYMPIQIRYRPKVAEYHIRKLVILCDNGEARWVAVKGIGIDPKQNPMIEVQGKWLAPPIDLPADISTRITLNCGDLLAGEKKTECFTIKNNSCMLLYYFFATRPVRLFTGTMVKSGSYDFRIQKEGFSPVEWKDYEDDITLEDTDVVPIKIFPAQGILRGYETLECCVTVQAPQKIGYYSTMLSLFVQQLSEQQEYVLSPILNSFACKFSNDIPVTLETISKVLPVIEKLDKGNKGDEILETANKVMDDIETQEIMQSENVATIGTTDDEEEIEKPKKQPFIPSYPPVKSETVRKVEGPPFHATKFAFPPTPFFYIQDADLESEESELHGVRLLKLEYPDSAYRRNAKKFDKWEDGDSLDGHNEDEEFAYAEYFQKVCQLFQNGQLVLPQEDPEEQDETEETQEKEEVEDEREVGEEEGEDKKEPDHLENLEALKDMFDNWESHLEESGEGFHDKSKKNHVAEDLEYEGCVLARRILQAKLWLSDKSPLQPSEELEVWLKTVPLKCSFNPSIVCASGSFSQKVFRTTEFTNGSSHTVRLTLDSFVNEVGSIICRPFDINVEAKQTISVQLTIDFRRHGDYEGKIKGSVKLPFAVASVWIPFRLTSQGPEVCIVTPIVNFGLVRQGTEHVQTIVVRNQGTLRTKWRAAIPSQNLQDDEFREMLLPEPVSKYHLLRVWPEWGYLEPQETLGIQIYLCGECPKKIATVCRIVFDENPEETHCVTVLAEVQCTQVVLRQCRLTLLDAFRGLSNYSVKARLKNLTSLETPFKWLKPFGTQGEFFTLKIIPESGRLPPKGSLTCHFEFFSDVSIALTNVFVPCCIGGKTEPLIVKLEGTVFSLCIKIVIPKTRLMRIQKEELPWECQDQIWPRICGLPEIPSEDAEETSFVQQLGIYGKYCLIKQLATQAPPPSVTDEEAEEMITPKSSMLDLQRSEEETEEEEMTSEEESSRKKGKKGKKEKKEKGKKKKKGTKDGKKKKGKKGKSKSKLKLKDGKSKTDESGKEEKGEKKGKKKKKKEKGESKKGKKGKGKKGKGKSGNENGATEEEDTAEEAEELPQDDLETEVEQSPDEDEGIKETSFQLIPEDYDPALMESEGRQIYFQIRRHGQIASVTFDIYNESPLSAVYAFKVTNHPIMPQVEGLGDFVKLDDMFMRRMKDLYTKEENFLRGKRGAVFHVLPAEGILEPYGHVEVTVEFHANADGIYEDKLECYFEGLEKPYVIHLEALAVLCRPCSTPQTREQDVRPESPIQVCVRKKNPLLYDLSGKL